MTEDPVLFTVAAGIARITLNRPARLNALTRETMLRLGGAVDEACERDDVRVLSLTGAGRGFCAGQDLAERDTRGRSEPFDLAAIQRELFHPVIRRLAVTPKPVVACVNGVAAGAGAGLALAADIVIAAESAAFVFSFVRVGLSVDAGLGRALALALGPARAKALLMLGETLPAPGAAAAGLIWAAVPDAALTARHDALLAQLTAAAPAALAGIKRAVGAAPGALDAYLAVEAEAQGLAGAQPEYAAAVLAFLQRRG